MRSHSHVLIALLLTCVLGACTVVPADTPVTPAALQRHALGVEGHELALWSREVQQAKGAILLLHGRTWSALPNFDLQVPGQQRSVMSALNAAGYSVFALDQRGYGSTPRDATGWLTPERASADVVAALAWVARRTGQTPSLLGYSQGSLVAQMVAQREPQLLSALILFGYPRDPANPPLLTAPAATPPREVNTRERAQSDFISPAVTPPAVVEAYVSAALAADPIRVDWRELQQFGELEPKKVQVPTLVLHGERDPLTPLVTQGRLFTALGNPDRRWVVLPGGDHAAMVEDTQPAFIAAIVSFLQRPAVSR